MARGKREAGRLTAIEQTEWKPHWSRKLPSHSVWHPACLTGCGWLHYEKARDSNRFTIAGGLTHSDAMLNARTNTKDFKGANLMEVFSADVKRTDIYSPPFNRIVSHFQIFQPNYPTTRCRHHRHPHTYISLHSVCVSFLSFTCCWLPFVIVFITSDAISWSLLA